MVVSEKCEARQNAGLRCFLTDDEILMAKSTDRKKWHQLKCWPASA